MQFLKGEGEEKKEVKGFRTTLGTGQIMINNSLPLGTQKGGGLMRGKSLNYSKPQNQHWLENPRHSRKESHDTKTKSNYSNQPFLTYKLETPKIVTVKK